MRHMVNLLPMTYTSGLSDININMERNATLSQIVYINIIIVSIYIFR